ncbi:hypothetical protein GIB67_035880 [Kingdonia uniflora]|uniref:COPA/B second beta-propeller domain-containing protein n=1 Tax=Kingdonia uniflora TaxID=39325 RepID=A0A7J7P8U7_9MAGN|nr:hypothetical protein GIB67_038183 [Kingdonia uniflora]KAF6175753.1 hypothetical protein GIB67_035880 [Kingdonia uniflora]
MDSSGKIIWAKHNEIQTVNIRSVGVDFEAIDGERLPLAVKELGSCDLYPQSLRHNPNGSDTSFYILKYNRDIVSSFLDSGIPADEQGVEDAFELLHETNERVRTELWVGDCFIYNNSSWRLNYCVGGEVTTMFHLDRPMYLLGYLAGQSRVYLIDKEFNVIGYTILLSLIEYKTLVKTSIILDKRGFPSIRR